MILDEDEPDSLGTASGDIETNAAERDASLCRAMNPPGLERWHDIEADCYVDEEPPVGLQREEQQGSAVSSPAHYSAAAATQHQGHDFAFQQEDDAVGAQGITREYSRIELV